MVEHDFLHVYFSRTLPPIGGLRSWIDHPLGFDLGVSDSAQGMGTPSCNYSLCSGGVAGNFGWPAGDSGLLGSWIASWMLGAGISAGGG